jgi:hypothetical protein
MVCYESCPVSLCVYVRAGSRGVPAPYRCVGRRSIQRPHKPTNMAMLVSVHMNFYFAESALIGVHAGQGGKLNLRPGDGWGWTHGIASLGQRIVLADVELPLLPGHIGASRSHHVGCL